AKQAFVYRGKTHVHIFSLSGVKETDFPISRELLRANSKRPRRRTAQKRDEFAPFHSITSSAVASSVGGMVRLSAFAVFRLITSSNLVGCSTGKSPGLAPLRILSTKLAAARQCHALDER